MYFLIGVGKQSWNAELFFTLLVLVDEMFFKKLLWWGFGLGFGLVLVWIFFLRFHVVFQVFYEALEHKCVCFISRLWHLSQF